MKNLVIALAVGALFLGLIVTFAPAQAGFSFEDPQICLNGKLARVDPTTAAIDVWLKVGAGVDVDFNVINCGGNPDLPVIDPSQVSYGGKKNTVEVTVYTAPKAQVEFWYAGKGKTEKADKHGVIEFSKKIKD
jgi:hypothetical protein